MHDQRLVKSRTVKWLHGVLMQGERILQQPASRPIHCTGCDTHFFAISLASLLYWLGKTDLDSVPYRKEVSDIQNALSGAKDVRDMLEHDGDYIIGRGRKQDEYQIEKVVNNGKKRIIGLSPFTLFRSDEGTSLGGRIPVEDSIRLCGALLRNMSEPVDGEGPDMAAAKSGPSS